MHRLDAGFSSTFHIIPFFPLPGTFRLVSGPAEHRSHTQKGICPVVGLLDHMIIYGTSQVVLVVKNPPANAGDIRGAG